MIVKGTKMAHRPQSRFILLMLVALLTLSACQTRTVEVTRIKIMERRVIERVIVTVEVTRIPRPTATPRPTPNDVLPLDGVATPTASNPPTPTATAAPPPPPAPQPTAPPVSSARQTAEELLAGLKSTEQTLLLLVQALSSDPLPVPTIVTLYDTLRNAPELSIAEGDVELQSIDVRYREQLDFAVSKGTDLYNHLAAIQAGEAEQTEVSPIHLALAQEGASGATSNVQALIRELESYLATLP